jgi:ABC-type uncharacterized transport system involved in gliding motility auxiliary subunit
MLEAARRAEPRFRFRVVDPDREPLLASQYDLREYATIVQVGERHEAFRGDREEDFLAALLRAFRPERARIVFLQGHGESHPEDNSPRGLITVSSALKLRGYGLFGSSLIEGAALDDSVHVLIIAGPTVPLGPTEEDSVRAYLERGGRALVLLDPTHEVGLDRVLDVAGIRFHPAYLADPELPDPQTILPADYSRHPVVASLRRQRIPVLLPGAGAVPIEREIPGIRQAVIMRSSDRTLTLGDPADAPRSRALCSAAEWNVTGRPPGRLVVIGDADFPTERHVGRGGNADLFLNAVQWLAEEEALIDLGPRSRSDRPVILQRQQGRALMVLLVGILPLAVIAAGAVVFWRRR